MNKGRGRFPRVTANDVIRAVKEQRRHARAYGEKLSLPDVKSITVHEASEDYMLDCSITMRAEDGEFRIANPFGKP